MLINTRMKRFLLYFLVAFASLSAFAELNGDGYYYLRNAATKRYIYILDDKGSYSIGNTTADVGAIGLYLNFDAAHSDPATILYLQNSSNSFYDIAAQGTSLHGILDVYVKIYKATEYNGALSYYIYASKSGLTKYLGDTRTDMEREDGISSVDAKSERRYWHINPVNSDTNDYFGINPSVTAGGKYYQPFFAGFPFSAKSAGVKFYVVTGVDPVGVVVVKEISGTVPAGVPVIVECSNPLATDNRLNIGVHTDYADASGNLLGGVYFDNSNKVHYNRTTFDRNSMRVLGEVDGKLAFVRGDYDFIPRNQAYLSIPDANLYEIDNFQVMTAEELEAYKVWLAENSVDAIAVDSTVDVYGIDGHLVKEGILKSEVRSLGKGLYILRSGNHAEKLLVK